MIKHGTTRLVFLLTNYVIKIPQIYYEWGHFLYGLLANMQEKRFWDAYKHERLCPVCFSFPGGFLLIMKRAKAINGEQFSRLDYDTFREINSENWLIPVENKQDSFGILNDKIVAIDYGS